MKKTTFPINILIFITSSICCASTLANTTLSTLDKQISKLTQQTKQLKHDITYLKTQKKTLKNKDKPWAHFVTVTTTPFMGKHLSYDGSDLLYNTTTINEDMYLLEQKKNLVKLMHDQGYTLNRPVLQVSGGIEGMLSSVGSFSGGTNDGITLSTAEIQFNAIASSWATGFMSMDYSGAPISTGNREPNSQIYLGRGFVTFGNFARSPIYFSIGLMYPPFGRYASSMVSSSMTSSLAKLRLPAALLGIKLNNGLYGSVYGFTGNKLSGANNIFRQGGVNIGYKHVFSSITNVSLGAGWVSNIADSQGMQNTGVPTSNGNFGGFAATNNGNALAHRVSGIDGYATVGVGPFSFLTEYVGASESFSAADLTYNGTGAQPTALHGELDYMLPFFAKKYQVSLGASYDQTWQSLGLNLPRKKYAVFLNGTIWRNTTASIEYNHQVDYSINSTSLGRGATTEIFGTGKIDNSVIGEIGVYF